MSEVTYRIRVWWHYAYPDALDFMDFGPDHECWYLDDAPWHVVWSLLVAAMFIVAVSA